MTDPPVRTTATENLPLRGASGTVHWVGTGLSTGSGLTVLAERADRLLLWARDPAKAERLLRSLGAQEQATVHRFDGASFAAQVHPGDVVVSMLPATEHAGLLRTCLDRQAHFACTSYASAEIEKLATDLGRRGLAALAEAGLDPGIDHLMAHDLVERARDAIGAGPAVASFTSFCGGIPAVPNDFRYRFSWAPRGVLTALRTPARYVSGGAVREVDHPWEAVRPMTVDGETFEVYPNRDSLGFVQQYGFPDGWRLEEFVRGTLRLDGWRAAWSDVFDVLPTASDAELDSLAAELAARHPVTDTDADRVVLAVALTVQPVGEPAWHGRHVLDVIGDERGTAMARCVSLPLAAAVADILAGRASPGLARAAPDVATARRYLRFLTDHDLAVTTDDH